MTTTKTISVLVLAAASAWSQTAASKPAAKTTPPAKASASKPASQMAPAPAVKTTATKTAATKTTAAPKATTAAKTSAAPVKPATKTAAAAAKPATKAPAKTAAVKTPPTKAATGKTVPAKAPAAKTAPPKAVAKSIVPERPIGKRDPFVSVIVARSDVAGACTGGKRCLLVDQLALRGIVRTPTKWIALVENPARKTYYLYENDPIFNAVVVRITGDSVIFRESVMDALGHSTEREVVKRVNAPAI